MKLEDVNPMEKKNKTKHQRILQAINEGRRTKE